MLAWDARATNNGKPKQRASDIHIITSGLCLIAFQASPATSEAPRPTPRHDIPLPGRLARSSLSIQRSCHDERGQRCR